MFKVITMAAIGLFGVCLILMASMAFAQAGTLPAQLDWSNTDTADTIQVEKGPALTGPFTVLNILPANTATYLDGTNSAGTLACYKVAYKSSSGIGPYAGPVCKTFPAIPSQAPASFTVK